MLTLYQQVLARECLENYAAFTVSIRRDFFPQYFPTYSIKIFRKCSSTWSTCSCYMNLHLCISVLVASYLPVLLQNDPPLVQRWMRYLNVHFSAPVWLVDQSATQNPFPTVY